MDDFAEQHKQDMNIYSSAECNVMEKIVKETDKYVLIRYHEDRSDTSKEKKFLCLGGRFDGEWRARIQLEYENYVAFNAGERLGRGFRRRKSPFSQVWIHASKLISQEEPAQQVEQKEIDNQ